MRDAAPPRGAPGSGEPDPAVGMVIEGRYQVQALIAAGGMARVYRGVHLRAGSELAIKLMDPELSREPTMKTRCLDEARALMGAQSNHIVSAIDVGELPGGQLFLVMEYLRGEDLDQLLRREGPLPWARVAAMAAQICAGLASAHRREIIHRDIKPQNCVRIEADDNPDHIKIIDFGVARKAGLEQGPTRQGFLLGTTQYMAPELGRGAKPSVSTDIYALGITMYKLLTGAVPFNGKDGLQTLRLHAEAPLVPPSEAAPHLEIPAEADEIVGSALAKRPEDRFASAEAMGRALRAALGLRLSGLHTPPVPVSGPYPPVTPPPAQALQAPVRGVEEALSDPATSRPPATDRQVLMLRATLLALVSALFSVGTWIVSPAEAGEPGDPPTATPARSAGPVESAAEEERPPEPISAPEAPVLEEPQPARDPGAPEQPAAVPPEEELIVEPESTEGPEPEPPVVEAPDKPEPDFDYVEAQKNVEDQLSFLRNCMLKGDKPLTVLKFRADVQPRGRPIFHVFGSNREARACVREGMRRCMFDPSPRGGAFVYTVTNTTGKLRRVPVNPKYVKVPTP